MINLICPICEETFEKTKSEYDYSVKKHRLMFCSLICAGRHGGLKFKESNRLEYEKNPKACMMCGHIFSFEEKHKKFCDTLCSAKFNNKKKEKTCIHCSVLYTHGRYNSKHCSKICRKLYRDDILMKKFLKGKISSPFTIRKLLFKIRGHKCESCNLDSWLNQLIPVDTDHIDGNSENNMPKNLRLLCKNCHGLTPTYGNKNKGRGRKIRRLSYKSRRGGTAATAPLS
jgi:5-methylcytosine-specific restriction endonuclease McrA